MLETNAAEKDTKIYSQEKSTSPKQMLKSKFIQYIKNKIFSKHSKIFISSSPSSSCAMKVL